MTSRKSFEKKKKNHFPFADAKLDDGVLSGEELRPPAAAAGNK